MRFVKLFALISLFIALPVHALVPATGLWGGLGEPGRGMSIELQDDNMFVTFYGYQPDGVNTAFYTSLGKYNPATGVMTGYFAAAANGQCYGCPPRSPTLTDLGQVRFEFSSRTSGRVFIPGVAQPINIVQSVLRVGNTSFSRDELYGQWVETFGAIGLYFGDALWFRDPYESTTLTNAFSGNRVDSTQILLGSSAPAGFPYLITVLIDTSPSYYRLVAFTPTLTDWVGASWTYLKTSSPTGSGLTSSGHRTLGRVYSQSVPPWSIESAGGQADPRTSALVEMAAQATASAARDGDPATIKIGTNDVPFALIKQAAQNLAAQLQLSQ